MGNQEKAIALIFWTAVVLTAIFLVFHFWLFPTGIEVLSGFDWLNVTSEFTHALYWFIVGLFVLWFIKSIKITL